ncbi:MAG: nicotinate-nucleotide diphosphorylase, partial [Verrucomicrobiota bacterium]
MTELTEQEIDGWVAAALAEDVGGGDVTTLACLPAGSRSRALLRAREACVVGGMALAVAAFRHLDANVRTTLRHADGRSVGPGEVLLEVAGHTRALLTAERVALNFVQRLSGVATLTARYVAAVAGTGARILDTRKTTPGWRRLEKYAVACGGGTNHRFGLHDLILIKDN